MQIRGQIKSLSVNLSAAFSKFSWQKEEIDHDIGTGNISVMSFTQAKSRDNKMPDSGAGILW